MPKIHYVEIALRIEYDPKLTDHLLAVARKFVQETTQVPVDEDDDEDEACRPMTEEEVAEDVSDVNDALVAIVENNPLFEQLGLSVIASQAGLPCAVARIEAIPLHFEGLL